jgi:hypothetical protein
VQLNSCLLFNIFSGRFQSKRASGICLRVASLQSLDFSFGLLDYSTAASAMRLPHHGIVRS